MAVKKKKETSTKAAQTPDGKIVTWKHPGGKLWRLGSESLTDAELLAVIIGSGVKDTSAEEIAGEIMHRYQSFRGIAGHDLNEFLQIKGLDKVKIARLAAAWEIAGRIVKMVLEDREKNE